MLTSQRRRFCCIRTIKRNDLKNLSQKHLNVLLTKELEFPLEEKLVLEKRPDEECGSSSDQFAAGMDTDTHSNSHSHSLHPTPHTLSQQNVLDANENDYTRYFGGLHALTLLPFCSLALSGIADLLNKFSCPLHKAQNSNV